jgi:hypothetical protein
MAQEDKNMESTSKNLIMQQYTIDPNRIDLGKASGFFHIHDYDELLPLSDKQKQHVTDDWGGYLFKGHVEAARLVTRRKIGEPMTIAIRRDMEKMENSENDIFSMMLCRFGKNPIDGRKCLQRYTMNYFGEEIIDVDYANTFRDNRTNSYHSYFIASHIGYPGGSTGAIVRVQIHLENCEGIFNISEHGEMELIGGNLSPTGIHYLQGQVVFWMQKAYEFDFQSPV